MHDFVDLIPKLPNRNKLHTGDVLLFTTAVQFAFPLRILCRNGEPLHIYFSDVYGPVIPAISFCRNKSLTLRFPPFPVKMSSEAGGLLSPTLSGQREGRSSPIPIPDPISSRTWVFIIIIYCAVSICIHPLIILIVLVNLLYIIMKNG